jgi:hypothetical protein
VDLCDDDAAVLVACSDRPLKARTLTMLVPITSNNPIKTRIDLMGFSSRASGSESISGGIRPSGGELVAV